MLDIKFVRENPELVKENIKKKFQDSKLLLVDDTAQPLPRAMGCAHSAISCPKALVR
jgi:hypothetical protein